MNVLSAGHRQSLETGMTPVGTRRTIRLLLISLCFGYVIAWGGCNTSETSVSHTTTDSPLACKTAPPNSPGDEEFQPGHSAGAINNAGNRILHAASAQSRNIAPAAAIQVVPGEAGIDMPDSVVVYTELHIESNQQESK